MPTSTRGTPLGRYRYDALDRQVECTPFQQAAIQSYYCQKRLSSEIQSAVQRSIVQFDDQLLAQQQYEGGKVVATLLATDQQRSVLRALDANRLYPFAYTPYGHRLGGVSLPSIPGFNGERPDPVTRHYHLGNGYRQFNPVLMRFNSPDSMSPFGKGGFNAYTYCGADPINRSDPTGHSALFVLLLGGVGVAAAGVVTSVVGTIIDNPTVKSVGWTAAVVGIAAVTIGWLGVPVRSLGISSAVNRPLRESRSNSIAGSGPLRESRSNSIAEIDPPPSYDVALFMPKPDYSHLNVSSIVSTSPQTGPQVTINAHSRSVKFSNGPTAGQSAIPPESLRGADLNSARLSATNINSASSSRSNSFSSGDVNFIRK